ncbi:uncharacterized protein F5147DRAFT_728142 [Suillus discolor]|uniref:Uncharacterized protein n=1 Tax=Suillus discolor TaxID=1912936 RepID=A0A9P7JM38_9AGAM|nr:uncharacterized protein F5147DRAFT_728142 [Suillus discolor]KAG2087199.1 hypothetical protein F5147DRAFT_728142 [Suillus discolor]
MRDGGLGVAGVGASLVNVVGSNILTPRVATVYCVRPSLVGMGRFSLLALLAHPALLTPCVIIINVVVIVGFAACIRIGGRVRINGLVVGIRVGRVRSDGLVIGIRVGRVGSDGLVIGIRVVRVRGAGGMGKWEGRRREKTRCTKINRVRCIRRIAKVNRVRLIRCIRCIGHPKPGFKMTNEVGGKFLAFSQRSMFFDQFWCRM